MNTPPPPTPAKRHRFPAALIHPGVWRYCRFCLSSRDGEALRAARGIILTYEAVRDGGRTCGPVNATRLRRRRPRPGAKGPLDDGLRTIQGARHDWWRAVVFPMVAFEAVHLTTPCTA
jgi:putative transposase